MVQAVVFDVGETIVSEERIWTRWAERLGVPPFLFFSALGAIIERDGHHREVFEEFSPGFDVDAVSAADPVFGSFDAGDLYPDAAACLTELRARGYGVGLAGNQPARAEEVLAGLGLPVDFVAASQAWGVEKPSPAFFENVAAAAAVAATEIAYVGDRLDNDVLPALAAGMVAVFIRRGPWGHIHSRRPEVERAHLRIDVLSELPDALARLRSPQSS